jgi:hypothetical protein
MRKHHRGALRRLASINVEIEKLSNTPKWRAGRIILARFRNLRSWPDHPPRRIPRYEFRSTKIGHWLKDHLKRIRDMAADAVCREANGFHDCQSPDSAVGAFNDHMAPIAKLYGFKLQMVVDGDRLKLDGDVNKALCVLMYLSTEKRTPEIDWMLDFVTVCTSDPRPVQWEASWYRKLRHTKRGKWWRARRELRKQQAAIEAPKERQKQVSLLDWADVIDDDSNRASGGRHVAPKPTMSRQEGDRTNAKRFLGQTQYYDWIFKGKPHRCQRHQSQSGKKNLLRRLMDSAMLPARCRRLARTWRCSTPIRG